MDNATEMACQRLVIGSYSLMDQGRYEEAAALFTDDATWVRGGKAVTGRASILTSLRQRPQSDISRHIITNIFVEQTSQDDARATACLIPFRGSKREDGTVATPPIAIIGDVLYQFRRRDSWLIAYLKPNFIFN